METNLTKAEVLIKTAQSLKRALQIHPYSQKGLNLRHVGKLIKIMKAYNQDVNNMRIPIDRYASDRLAKSNRWLKWVNASYDIAEIRYLYLYVLSEVIVAQRVDLSKLYVAYLPYPFYWFAVLERDGRKKDYLLSDSVSSRSDEYIVVLHDLNKSVEKRLKQFLRTPV